MHGRLGDRRPSEARERKKDEIAKRSMENRRRRSKLLLSKAMNDYSAYLLMQKHIL